MVLLKIENCEKCTLLLPPVGQLPSLRNLFIKGMASVKYIGGEFYGDGGRTGFLVILVDGDDIDQQMGQQQIPS